VAPGYFLPFGHGMGWPLAGRYAAERGELASVPNRFSLGKRKSSIIFYHFMKINLDPEGHWGRDFL